MTTKILMLVVLITFGAFAQVKTKIQLMGGDKMNKNIESALTEFINAANNAYKKGKPVITNQYITKTAIENILKIWDVTKFYCNQENLKLSIVETADNKKFEVRNIPLYFLKGDSLAKEYCLVSISPEGYIDDFLLGLDPLQYDALTGQGVTVTDQRRRQIILGFVEEYRTAYNKRDIDFIEKVFSDKAIVIKGTVYVNVDNEEILKQIPKEKIKFVKMTKAEYISDLKVAFKALNYLKVDFERIEMLRHRFNTNVYGITLFQKWNQDGYNDVGYLFLLINFKDEEHPTIHVRAWQPENPNSDPDPFIINDFEVL